MEIEKETPPMEEEILDFDSAIEEVRKTLDLNKPMEKDVVGAFVNKSALLGKTIDYEIVNVSLVPNHFSSGKMKLVLNVQDSKGEMYLIDVSSTNKNWLISEFGSIPNEWIGKTFKAKYSSFEKQGRNNELLKGVQVEFL